MKPFVFSNLATSLDGKIATASRVLYPLGTAEDRRHMQRLRAQSDVVLFGASSLRPFKLPCIVSGPEAKKLKHQPANAVLSSKAEGLSPSWPFFTRPGFERLLIVGAKAPAKNLRPFEKSCEIFQLKNSDAQSILELLAAKGYSKVLVEGGGQVMWDFARDNLIDEYHVTLTPKIIGGTESPTLVDGLGLEPRQVLNLKLKACRRIGDELYLTYAKTSRRG